MLQLINFLNSPMGQDIIMVLAVIVTALLHKVKPKIQEEIAAVLPQQEAEITNELLDLIDQVTESKVQNAKTQIVDGLKQHNLFTPDTAKAVKQSVVDDVMKNFTNVPDSTEWIVSQLIEKHVAQKKAP